MYRIRLIDCVHALSTLLVFLVFATSSSDVHSCFFPHTTANGNALMMNLPLAVGGCRELSLHAFPDQTQMD